MMPTGSKKAVLALLIFIAVTTFSGCWDRREPEDLTHALLLGFDVDDQGNYEVTVQFSNPLASASAMGGGGGGGGGGGFLKKPSWSNTAKGQSPFDAVQNLAQTTTRVIELDHLQVVLFSERLARKGLDPVLEFILRDPEFRLTPLPIVVKGDNVRDIAAAEFPLEITASLGLDRLLRLSRYEQSIQAGENLRLKIMHRFRPGQEMTMPVIRVLEQAKGQAGGNGDMAGGKSQLPPVELAGAAAFRGDSMVGWLDARTSRGVLWVRNAGKYSTALISWPGGKADLQLYTVKTKIEPQIREGKALVKVRVKAHGQLRNAYGMDTRDPEALQEMRRVLANLIREDVEAAVERARELSSDFLGFGYAFYRKYYKAWANGLGQRWEEVLKTLPVEIEVEAVVHGPGLVVRIPPAKGG